MKYHDIKHEDQLNGEGIRVTLFVSGCSHHCKECQNPITWDSTQGLLFTQKEFDEIFKELDKDYVAGVTLSGGDPLYEGNRDTILNLVTLLKHNYPDKTIWIYSGYTFGEILADPVMNRIIKMCDVLVDGEYKEELKDVGLKWRGSSNQKVIDLKETFRTGEVTLFCD